MKLTVDNDTWRRLEVYFSENQENLLRLFEELGILDNLKGDVRGNQFIAESGEEFSYDPVERVIDSVVYINADNSISGFPFSDEQRAIVIAELRSKRTGQLYLLEDDAADSEIPTFKLHEIDGAQNVHMVVQSYVTYYLDTDGQLWIINPNDMTDAPRGPPIEIGDDDEGNPLIQPGDLLNPQYRNRKPKRVGKFSGIKKIFDSEENLIFVDSDGDVWGIGTNENNQLGAVFGFSNKVTDDPIQIMGLKDVENACFLTNHICYLTKKGDVWISGCDSDDEFDHDIEDAEEYYEHYEPKARPRRLDIEGIQQIASDNRVLYCLDYDQKVWKFDIDYQQTPVKSQAVGFGLVKSLVSGFERIGYLDVRGHFWEVSVLTNEPNHLKGFKNIKSYSMSLVEESSFDTLIDQNSDMWLIPREGKPIRYEGLQRVKQICAGYYTAIIA